MADPKTDTILDYFSFYPSRGLTIVGIVLFLLSSLAVLAMTIKTRQWYMIIATAVGLMEMGGYVCRLSFLNRPQFGPFGAMQCLLIIPPSFLALVQYITLGKVIFLVKQRFPDRRLLVKPCLVTWVFFALEIIALICQGAGAGLSVSDDGYNTPNQHVGRILLILGLIALVVLSIAYLLLAIFVNLSPLYSIKQSPNLRHLFPVLYTCTALLLIRNIFRLIEFAQGWDGAISNQEKYFYGFDALMIFLILVISTPFHFGIYLKAYPSEIKQGTQSPSIEVV